MNFAVNRSENRLIHFPFARDLQESETRKGYFSPSLAQRSRWRVGKLRSVTLSRFQLSILLHFPVPRHEYVLENVIRDAPALGNTVALVKRPMNTEVDAALAVLFLGLRE